MSERSYLWYSQQQCMVAKDYTVYLNAEGAPIHVTHVTESDDHGTVHDDMMLIGIVEGKALPVICQGMVHQAAAAPFCKAYGVPATKSNITERIISAQDAMRMVAKIRLKDHFQKTARMEREIEDLRKTVALLTEQVAKLANPRKPRTKKSPRKPSRV
jgi:hypothetical protein